MPKPGFLFSLALEHCLLIQESLSAPVRGQRGESHLRETAMVGK
jgi:hypothetical protein